MYPVFFNIKKFSHSKPVVVRFKGKLDIGKKTTLCPLLVLHFTSYRISNEILNVRPFSVFQGLVSLHDILNDSLACNEKNGKH